MIKKEKGITLLALGITIIVLLILSGVAIATLSGENGVIQRTIRARFEQERAQYQDFIDTAQAKVHMEDWKGETAGEELLGKIEKTLTDEEYFKGATYEINSDWGLPILFITTKEGHKFEVTEEEVRYIGSKEEIGDVETIQKANLKIEVPANWTNKKIKVTIGVNNENYKEEQYTIEYSAEGSRTELVKYEKEGFEVEKNTMIYAKLTPNFGSKEKFIEAYHTINKIDKEIPESLELSKKTAEVNSFELTTKFKDAEETTESGVSGLSKIIWYYKSPQDTEWQTKEDEKPPMNGTGTGQKEETRSLKIQDLTIGGEVKAYAEAYDVAGNSITSNYTKDNPLTFETAKYHIKYDANGGSGAPAEQEKNYGIEITLSSTVPNRTGYTFKGWSADRNASTPTWAAGGTYRDNENKTLYAVWKDETNPTVSVTPSTTTWTNGNVILTARAQDQGSGIVGYAWTTTNIAPTTWSTIAATTNPITPATTVTANGTRYFWAKDQAGNINSIATTVNNIDVTKATISITPSTTNWTSGNVTLTAKAQDTASGIIGYAWTTTATQPSSFTAITRTTAQITQTTTLTGNGTRYFWVKDQAGNINNAGRTVSNIDKTNPTISVTPSTTAWTSGNVTLTGRAQDTQSGIVGYAWTTTNATPTSWTSIAATTAQITQTTLLQANGTMYFWVKDAVGHVVSAGKTVSNIDKTRATVSITPSTTAWTNGNVVLTAKAQDTASGIVGYAWTTTATAPSSWTTIARNTGQITQTTTLTGNGTRYFWVKDQAGNINNAGRTVSNIDKTAPVAATIQLSSTYATGAITARVTYADNAGGSGVKSCKYMFNTTAGGIGTNAGSYNGTFSSSGQTITLTPSASANWYLHVLTVDNAGNARETISSAANLHVHVASCYSTACSGGTFVRVSEDTVNILTCSHTHQRKGTYIEGYGCTAKSDCYQTSFKCSGSCYSKSDSDLTWCMDDYDRYCNIGLNGEGDTTTACQWKTKKKGTVHNYDFKKYCNTCGQTKTVTGFRYYCSKAHALADAKKYPHACNKTLYKFSCDLKTGSTTYKRPRQLYRCNKCSASVYYYPGYNTGRCKHCGLEHLYTASGATSTTHNSVPQYKKCGR